MTNDRFQYFFAFLSTDELRMQLSKSLSDETKREMLEELKRREEKELEEKNEKL